MNEVALFTIAGKQFAIAIRLLERVIPALLIDQVPTANNNTLGIINIHGKILPVANMRALLKLPEKELESTDKIVVCHIADHLISFPVDSIEEIILPPSTSITSKEALGLNDVHIECAIQIGDRTILSYQWEKLLASTGAP